MCAKQDIKKWEANVFNAKMEHLVVTLNMIVVKMDGLLNHQLEFVYNALVMQKPVLSLQLMFKLFKHA
jgi:hypothetical protein